MKLNLGCGTRYREGWVNVDFIERPPHVLGHDISKGLPFQDGMVDFVYSSHVLEHFPRFDGQRLLEECFRILKPGGYVRIVVPDLEALVQNYLEKLNSARKTSAALQPSYYWSVLTLIDQLSRNKSGGEMIQFLTDHPVDSLSEIFEIEGEEIQLLHHDLHNRQSISSKPPMKIRSRLQSLVRLPGKLAKSVSRSLLDPTSKKKIKIGSFRLSGEVHYWLYDELSLGAALADTGFQKIRRRSASESYMKNWAAELLDTQPDGSVYKPLSLFMEARKPTK